MRTFHPVAGSILRLGVLLPTLSEAAWPPLASIRFEGNEVTREHVLLREMSVVPGDPADPVLIERSRQAILDLGLFRQVETQEEATPDGVALIVRVREKRCLLPIPRLDTSSDGD